IILWNKGTEKLLGYRRDEVIGRNCYDLIAGRDEAGNVICAQDCQVMQLARQKGTAPSHYCLMHAKNGEPIWASVTHIVVPLENKELEAVVHIFRDVSEYKEANDLVDKMASYVSKVSARSSKRETKMEAPVSAPIRLTKREREVLTYLSEGASPKVIAEKMVISVRTVRNHIQSILGKLGVHSALEAVAYASRNGLL
ncbi:MAG: helix-turn-helix transcriptional regulator, partial [Dehalococcoidia bacterium]